MMEQLAAEHPQYGWAHNKGYGSAEHMQAVLEYRREQAGTAAVMNL